MPHSIRSAIAVTFGLFAAAQCAAYPNIESIMASGDKIPEDTVLLFQEEKCRVAFQKDGNLSINKRLGNPPYNPTGPFPTMWNTGIPHSVGAGAYEYILKQCGNLRIIRKILGGGNEVVYTTHTRASGDGPFLLGIDEECILGIYEGTPGAIGKKVWTNIHTDLKPGDRMGRGEFFRDVDRDAFMVLQPEDGNLVVYDGQDYTDSSRTPLWASNTAGAMQDFHLLIRPSGSLKIYQDDPKTTYFSLDLKANGEDCFNVVIDKCTYAPVAKTRPCPSKVEEVMREGDTIADGTSAKFHSDKCTVTMQNDGNINVYTGFYFMWMTGWARPSAIGDYFVELSRKGNLIIKPGTPGSSGTATFATHTSSSRGEYFLGIDEDCVLGIYKGRPEDLGEQIWTNTVRTVRTGDRLGRSEVFYDEASNQSMLLQHPDGNLVVRSGFPGEIDYGQPPLWGAQALVSSIDTDIYDFFMKVQYDGKLKLFAIDDIGPDVEYWSRDLCPGQRCFDMALDDSTSEPVAIV